MSKAACIAVLGTGSDVGKSVVATGLCRILADRGVRVAPFKAQNMSNNSGVTPEGLEMGRAQIAQAEAARVAPQVDMNPILLKPTSEIGSQVVLLGKVHGNSSARDYHRHKEAFFAEACAALDRLRAQFEVIVMEGAGSCAEVNLMPADIVNLRMAEYADAPVVLVADIHRGGVFAQILGTLACLPPPQRERVAGCIVNRFRGDLSLFADGVRWIEARTAKPVFGVLPWYEHIRIASEDSVVIETPEPVPCAAKGQAAGVAVIRLPHIANFTDFEPLGAVAGLGVHFLERLQPLEAFRAVILPGSKNTRFDLEWLIATGWAKAIAAFAGSGGAVLGICGGYQMLGRAVHDPEGHEGAPGSTPGLGLLPVETVLKAPKRTTLTRFAWQGDVGEGYEIHMGRTVRDGGRPLLTVHARNGRPEADEDGCCDARTKVAGTYIHGLFDTPAVTARWLEAAGIAGASPPELGGLAARSREYGRLADHLAAHVDIEAILGLAGKGGVS
jgi:adenosylcobyric acid synthase